MAKRLLRRHLFLAGPAVAAALFLTACGQASAPTRPSPPAAVSALTAAFAQGTPGLASRSLQALALAATGAANPPTSPTSLVSGGTVTLSWSANGNPAGTVYVVEASTDAVFAVIVASIETTQTSLLANDVAPGTYYVRVRAINSTGASTPTTLPTVVVAAGACTGPPSPPTSLRYTRLGQQLYMEWNGVARASEYIIEAGSVSGANDVYVGSAGLATTVTAIIPETTHAFVRVRAKNACGTSLFFDQIEIGALWTVSFTRLAGLNANACVPNIANGGLCSQVLVLRNFGQFDEIWSPSTPVIRATGSMTATQFTATVACINGAASGSIQATWNGERYIGTASLGGVSTAVKVTPGNYDPQCLIP